MFPLFEEAVAVDGAFSFGQRLHHRPHLPVEFRSAKVLLRIAGGSKETAKGLARSLASAFGGGLGRAPTEGHEGPLLSAEVVDHEILGDSGEVRPVRGEAVVVRACRGRKCPSKDILDAILELESGLYPMKTALSAPASKVEAFSHDVSHQPYVRPIDTFEGGRIPPPKGV